MLIRIQPIKSKRKCFTFSEIKSSRNVLQLVAVSFLTTFGLDFNCGIFKYAKKDFNWEIPINSLSILFPSFVYESTGNLKFQMCVLLEINYRFALFSHRKFLNEISAYGRTRSYINNGAAKHRLHVLIKKTSYDFNLACRRNNIR